MRTITFDGEGILKDFEVSLLRFFIKNVSAENIVDVVDSSALVLEPGCIDIVCGPLSKGIMPDKDAANRGTDLSLLPLQELCWCISEFIFRVPANEKLLIGWEKLYLWFCFWYGEHWTCGDEESKSLVNMTIAAIELNDDIFSGLLSSYVRSVREVTSIHSQLERDNLHIAAEVLNMSAALRRRSHSIHELRSIHEKVSEDDFDPEMKKLWMDSLKKFLRTKGSDRLKGSESDSGSE